MHLAPLKSQGKAQMTDFLKSKASHQQNDTYCLYGGFLFSEIASIHLLVFFN